MSDRRITFKIIAVLLVAVLVFSGCSGAVVYKSKGLDTVLPDVSAFNHSAQYSSSAEISKWDTKLFLDKKSLAPAVSYTSSGKLWRSMPAAEISSSAVFSLTAVYENKMYFMNSQDNSVSLSGAQYSADSDRLVLSYTLWPDSLKRFEIRLSLEFSVSSGQLKVFTDTDKWEVTDGAVVTSFNLLPWFGAVAYDKAGLDLESDYFCVPDGSGALIYTKKGDVTMTPLTYNVYTGQVIAPVFGVKQDSSAFSCVTVDGDEALSVVCDTTGVYKTIYNSFTLARADSQGKTFVRNYSGPITCVYTFVEGSRISFADISASARSACLEYGMLTHSATDVSHSVVRINCTDGDGNVISNTDSIQSLLGLLKGKGIDNIKLVLDSACVPDGKSLSLVRGFEGSGGLEELHGFARAQGASVYLSADVLTSSKSADALKNANGDKAEITLNGENRYNVGAAGVDKLMNGCISATGILEADGINLNDASAGFVSSSKERNSSAQDISRTLSAGLNRLSDKSSIAVTGGYFSCAALADELVAVPVDCVRDETDAYVSEPFILAILHGCTEYSISPVNAGDTQRFEILRAIEFGCSPCVSWSCSPGSPDYFEYSLTDCADFMFRVSSKLGDLTDAEITDHYLADAGVYCTEYDSKTVVYVNYNNHSVTLGNVIVMPYDFVRLN